MFSDVQTPTKSRYGCAAGQKYCTLWGGAPAGQSAHAVAGTAIENMDPRPATIIHRHMRSPVPTLRESGSGCSRQLSIVESLRRKSGAVKTFQLPRQRLR